MTTNRPEGIAEQTHVLVATDNRIHAICTCIHMAQMLAVIMQSKRLRLERVGAPRPGTSGSAVQPAILTDPIKQSKRPQLERVGAPRSCSSGSVVQPAMLTDPINDAAPEQISAVQPAMLTDPIDDLAPEQIWTIKPSHYQPPQSEFERTNDRPMPLPFAIDLVVGGKTHPCLCIGHGQSKVVYRVADESRVLKLTTTKDNEPYACSKLSRACSDEQPAVKICPIIYAIGRCQEQDQQRKRIREWFAWLAEYAIPLDKYMLRLNVDRKACLKLALYKQVIAAQHGFLLSDNNLFNFGLVDNTVVIIDMGSRPLQPQAILKSRMNSASIQRWWYKLRWQCQRGELEECRAI